MQKAIPYKDRDELARILGLYDRNLRLIRSETGAKIFVRDGEVRLQGSRRAVERAYEVLLQVKKVAEAGFEITEEEVESLLETGSLPDRRTVLPPGEDVFRKGITLEARSAGQKTYLEEIDRNTITFAIGPAGTGKTFLAVAKAVEAMRAGRVRRIVLVRPVVEAGERLGFLPGDIEAKVNPYLRPAYDALNHFLEPGRLRRLIDQDIIEIAPLAYMRGRTLDDAFVLLDEGQNTTHGQMKMFLTRLGENSKMVVTGDVTQIDLARDRPSGLIEAVRLFRGVSRIGIVELGRSDVVRHPLVEKIVEVYERHEKRR